MQQKKLIKKVQDTVEYSEALQSCVPQIVNSVFCRYFL